jgi:hypothetical protein
MTKIKDFIIVALIVIVMLPLMSLILVLQYFGTLSKCIGDRLAEWSDKFLDKMTDVAVNHLLSENYGRRK